MLRTPTAISRTSRALCQPLGVYQKRHWQLLDVFSKKKMKERMAKFEEETARGYFQDFKELNKYPDGRVPELGAQKYAASGEGSLIFPAVHVSSLAGKQFDLNEQYFREAGPCVLLVGFRESCRPMLNKWKAALKAADPAPVVYDLSIINSWFVKKMSGAWLEGRSKQEPVETHSSMLHSFDDIHPLRKHLRMPNLLVSYTFVIDKNGMVRYRCCGSPIDEEVAEVRRALKDCTDA